MKRISGVDVNGWRDSAFRDWELDEPGENLDATKVVNGGLGSVSVRQASGAWIGGPQALLAPHGRGPGWGSLGGPERRVSIAAALDEFASGGPKNFDEIYCAAVHAIARGADDVVLAVPDIEEFNEAAQGRMLAAFHRGRKAVRLLWRPVAAFLHALESGRIPSDAYGELFCFLMHSGSGIEIQALRLRPDSEHPHHAAPERESYGQTILNGIGMRGLSDRALSAVLRANPLLNDGFSEKSMLPLRLICEEAIEEETEILRLHNGNWIEATAPKLNATDIFSDGDFPKKIDSREYDRASVSFLVTPLSTPLANALSDHLRDLFPNLQLLGWDAIARGSLRAGRLIEQGLPHYFDHLTSISLAVIRRDEPYFDDLVSREATLPANKEYVSPPYRDLKWPAGKRDIEFYVLKGKSEVRFWKVHVDEAPKRDETVELRLRQTPGQSWARLSLTSLDWEPLQRSPIFLDWAKLDPITESPAEILAKLRAPPPTVPVRLVEGASLEFWTGSGRLAGLCSIVQAAARDGSFRPRQIAQLLARSLRNPLTRARSWTIGTDGAFPLLLSDADQALFRNILAKCEKKVFAGFSATPMDDSGTLRCLTWAFTMCPERVQDELVNALEADLLAESHPFLSLKSARPLLTQGAGRAVAGSTRLIRVLTILTSRPANNDTLNALAMILSRREEAPLALTPKIVGDIVTIISDELIKLAEKLSFKVRFKNALSALAGLFRYREIEPFALLATRDPAAQRLRETLFNVDRALSLHSKTIPIVEEKRALVSLLCEYLDGAGDPNVLIRIEALDEQQDDADA
jgi:hypothetical protein